MLLLLAIVGSFASADGDEQRDLAASSKAELQYERMTVCADCTDRTDGASAICANGTTAALTFRIPLNECFNPRKQWPGEDGKAVWGKGDVRDTCVLDCSKVIRRLYSSENGTCSGNVSRLVLPTGPCLGPFGAPRPWGVFSCGDSMLESEGLGEEFDREPILIA